ncbi:MAG: amino acid permease [Hirschia sp.]|nr:amino acid permease [Hirschia sp.]MBF18407.1 amino acid permease [Hirschia sp.]
MSEPPDRPDLAPEPPPVDHVLKQNVPPAQLRRVIGFWGITFYGIGGIIGAGIFATIGAIAGRAGVFAPIAFLIAAVPAFFAALSYGALVKRMPQAGGEASYVQNAYGRLWLTQLTVVGVSLSGIVSAATLLSAFAGYFQSVMPASPFVVMAALGLVSAVLAGLGVSLASGVVVAVTLIEVGLLVLITVLGLGDIAAWPALIMATPVPQGLGFALAASAVLAFFAFIGFEDVVNMAEEVKDAPRVLPRALLVAFGVSLLLYVCVSAVAVSVVPTMQLATSHEPLGDVVHAQGLLPAWLMTLMAMASIGNGVIIQVNMVSRLVYGLTKYGGVPEVLGRVSLRTGTPLVGVAVTTGLVLLFAFAMPLAQLAELTGVIILIVFALVQTALIVILRRETAQARSYVIPVLGCVSALLLLIGAFF